MKKIITVVLVVLAILVGINLWTLVPLARTYGSLRTSC